MPLNICFHLWNTSFQLRPVTVARLLKKIDNLRNYIRNKSKIFSDSHLYIMYSKWIGTEIDEKKNYKINYKCSEMKQLFN